MSKCMLEEHDCCCCQCKYRLRALRHPDGIYTANDSWACIAFAFEEGEPIAYIGDFEHGICELFRPLPWENKSTTEKAMDEMHDIFEPLLALGDRK